MVSHIAPVADANPASPKRSAPGSSPCSPKTRRASCFTGPDGGLRAADEEGAAYWTLDAFAEAANEMGIGVGRSQVRRILLAEGVRWRRTRPWAESVNPEFVPKDRG
jgi:hypothetical protein